MTVTFTTINFDEPPGSGPIKVICRFQGEHLAIVDRAATILRMSREQFMRTVLLTAAKQVVHQTAEEADGKEQLIEPVSRKARFDPGKPPGL